MHLAGSFRPVAPQACRAYRPAAARLRLTETDRSIEVQAIPVIKPFVPFTPRDARSLHGVPDDVGRTFVAVRTVHVVDLREHYARHVRTRLNVTDDKGEAITPIGHSLRPAKRIGSTSRSVSGSRTNPCAA